MRRRRFIMQCSAACAAIGAVELPVLATAAAAAPSEQSSARAAFEALVGTRLRVYDGARFADALRLTRIDDGPASPHLEQFTLMLAGAYRPDLETRTYGVADASGVTRDMCLERTGPGSYRATFCLLRAPQTT